MMLLIKCNINYIVCFNQNLYIARIDTIIEAIAI